MLSFGNTICTAQISARPKSLFPLYEKLNPYDSRVVPGSEPLPMASWAKIYRKMDPLKSIK